MCALPQLKPTTVARNGKGEKFFAPTAPSATLCCVPPLCVGMHTVRWRHAVWWAINLTETTIAQILHCRV